MSKRKHSHEELLSVKVPCMESIQEKHDDKPTATDARLPAPLDVDRPADPQASTTNDTAIEVTKAAPSQSQAASAVITMAEEKDEVMNKGPTEKSPKNDQGSTSTTTLHNNQEGVQSTSAEDTGNPASESDTNAAAVQRCHQAMMDLGLHYTKRSVWSAEMDKQLLEYWSIRMSMKAIAEKLSPPRSIYSVSARIRRLCNIGEPQARRQIPVWTEEMDDTIIKAADSGLSDLQIAATLPVEGVRLLHLKSRLDRLAGEGRIDKYRNIWTDEVDRKILDADSNGLSLARMRDTILPTVSGTIISIRLEYLKAPHSDSHRRWTHDMRRGLIMAMASGKDFKIIRNNLFPYRSESSVKKMWSKLKKTMPDYSCSSSDFEAPVPVCKGVQTDEIATADPTEHPLPGFAKPLDPANKDDPLGLESDSSRVGSRSELPQLDGSDDVYELSVRNDSHEHGVDTVLIAGQASDTSSDTKESGVVEEGFADADLDVMDYDIYRKEEEGISQQGSSPKEVKQEEIFGFEDPTHMVDANSVPANDSNISVTVSSFKAPGRDLSNWSSTEYEAVLAAHQRRLSVGDIYLLLPQRTPGAIRTRRAALKLAALSKQALNDLEWTENMDSLLMEARKCGVPLDEVPKCLPFNVSTFDVVARLYDTPLSKYKRWTQEEDQKLLGAYQGGLTLSQIFREKILHRSYEAIRARFRCFLNGMNDARTPVKRSQGTSTFGIDFGRGIQQLPLSKCALQDQRYAIESQVNMSTKYSAVQDRSRLSVSSDAEYGSNTKNAVEHNHLAELKDRIQGTEKNARSPSRTSQNQALERIDGTQLPSISYVDFGDRICSAVTTLSGEVVSSDNDYRHLGVDVNSNAKYGLTTNEIATSRRKSSAKSKKNSPKLYGHHWTQGKHRKILAPHRTGLSCTEVHRRGIVRKSPRAKKARTTRLGLNHPRSFIHGSNGARTPEESSKVPETNTSPIMLGEGIQEESMNTYAPSRNRHGVQPQLDKSEICSTLKSQSRVENHSHIDNGSSIKTMAGVWRRHSAELGERAQEFGQETSFPLWNRQDMPPTKFDGRSVCCPINCNTENECARADIHAEAKPKVGLRWTQEMDAKILKARCSNAAETSTMFAGRSFNAVRRWREKLRFYAKLLNIKPQETSTLQVKWYPYMDNMLIIASEEGLSIAEILECIFRHFPAMTIPAIGKRLDYLKNKDVAQALGLSSPIGFNWPGEDDDESLIIPDEPAANIEEKWDIDLGPSSPNLSAQATAIEEDYVICDAGRRLGSLYDLRRLLLRCRALEELEERYVTWFAILDKGMKYCFKVIENARLIRANKSKDRILSPLLSGYNTFIETMDDCGNIFTGRLWTTESSEGNSAAFPSEHWPQVLVNNRIVKRASHSSKREDPRNSSMDRYISHRSN